MRMRLKSHLDERFDKCKEGLIVVNKQEKNAQLAALQKEYVATSEIFGNENKVYLDIGAGKGQFSIEFAKRHCDKNIIGIEMITNVLIDGLERAIPLKLNNLKFMNTGADYLLKYFKASSIDGIFLNFSTPKQKKSYANSRLTSKRFLEIYDEILKPGAKIYLKTDDDDFFEFSLQQFEEFGFELSELNRDLKECDFPQNIVTEYEQNFRNLGKPIKRVVAKKK